MPACARGEGVVTGAADRAAGRAQAVAEAITEALRDGNHQRALNLALLALQSEAAKLRRRRPADGAFTAAELAGSISGIAAQLHAHTPPRARRGAPGPADLLGAYEAGHARSGAGGSHVAA
jgi:hypothetical protein